jgi:hypothetical protein
MRKLQLRTGLRLWQFMQLMNVRRGIGLSFSLYITSLPAYQTNAVRRLSFKIAMPYEKTIHTLHTVIG